MLTVCVCVLFQYFQITISEIEQFDNEEEVVDIDWLTK